MAFYIVKPQYKKQPTPPVPPLNAIYGVEQDGTSRTDQTRTDDAIGLADPNPYYAGMSDTPSSPFDNISPQKDMRIVEDSDAGTLVEIPKFYYKLEQLTGNGLKIQISMVQFDGSVCSPAHMNRGDGNGERDYIYVGRYHCNYSTYTSRAGYSPLNNLTRGTARDYIHNLGTNIQQIDFATLFTIQLLYLVEFANQNSQAMIGFGTGGSSLKAMGYTNSMNYHTGTSQSRRSAEGLGTQYRNIEGLQDNCYDQLDGCYYYKKTGNFYIILNPNNFSNDTNGILVGDIPSGFPSSFIIKNVENTFPLFIPSAANGSSSTYSCDAQYSASGAYYESPCLYTGSDYSGDSENGLFYSTGSMVGSKGTGVGCRLMVLPPSRLSPPQS